MQARSWTAQEVPATGDLRAVATQDAGPVFLAGDGALLLTPDTGMTWQTLSTGNFRAVAAAQGAEGMLALGTDGSLWSYGGGALVQRAALPGMHGIAVSPDGALAMAVGTGISRSNDGGRTWTALAVDPTLTFDDVRIAEDGSAVAVGAAGAIANIDEAGAVSVQHVGATNLHTVHIADPDSTDAVGYAAGDAGQVLVTLDSGHTWTVGPNVGRTVYGLDEIGFGHR